MKFKSLLILIEFTFITLFISTMIIWGAEDRPVEKRIDNLEMQISDLNSRVL